MSRCVKGGRGILVQVIGLGFIAIILSGCVSMAEINAGFRRVEMAWDLDYQRTEDDYRARVVDAQYLTVYDAMKKTFLDLGMPLTDRSPTEGTLVARNTAPTPLTIEEWKEVKKLEEPRMKELGGWYFVFEDNPKTYLVTVFAAIKPLGNDKTLIVMDYELDAPEYRAKGVQPTKKAPPTAVRLASLKIWAGLNKRLSETSAPEVRKRKPTEISI